MAVDIGNEMHLAPGAGVAEGRHGQPDAPVAAADADMHDVAPAPFRIGRMDEFDEPLTFGGDFGDGRGGAQCRMPGRAFFGGVDDIAVQQAAAHVVKAAGRQQRPRRFVEFG